MPNLILLAGVPACGKSHFARNLFEFKYAIVSSDQIREELAGSLKVAHAEDIKPWDVFYERIEERLRHNVDVIADATFLTPRHRQRAREVADLTKSRLHLVIFKNVQTAELRNARRDDATKVPPPAFAGMVDLYWDTLSQIRDEDYDSVVRIQEYDGT